MKTMIKEMIMACLNNVDLETKPGEIIIGYKVYDDTYYVKRIYDDGGMVVIDRFKFNGEDF